MESSKIGIVGEQDLQNQFRAEVEKGLAPLLALGDIEAVVGVPFIDEDDSLPGVIETARRGLASAGLSARSLILCVGPSGAERTLETTLDAAVGDYNVPVFGLLHCRGAEGRGWSIRAILEAANRLGAALLVLSPDLVSGAGASPDEGRGYSGQWIQKLLTPVLHEKHDLSLGHFTRHPLAHPVESLLAFPVLAGVFGFRLRQPTPGVFAMSHVLVRACLTDAEIWSVDAGLHGFDPWMVTRAVVEGMTICEVSLGCASFRHDSGQLKLIFRQVTHSLMRQVVRHSDWWLERTDLVAAPTTYGRYLDVTPPSCRLKPDTLRDRFRREFNHFDDTLFRAVVPDNLRERMEGVAAKEGARVVLEADEWIEVLQRFLLACRFDDEFHPDDIVDGLFPFFLARLATFVDGVNNQTDMLANGNGMKRSAAATIARHEAEYVIEHEADIFVHTRSHFRQQWRDRETTPYLQRLGAWEFVPGVGVIVPQVIERPNEDPVWAHDVYKQLIDRYRGEFQQFLLDQFGIEGHADSSQILSRIHGFMHRLDWAISRIYPFDLSSVEGTRRMLDNVCDVFSDGGDRFALTADAAQAIIQLTPPGNLILQLGCGDTSELLDRLDARDALGMAGWVESPRYLEKVLDIIAKDGDPSWFGLAPARRVVVDLQYLTGATELSGTSGLARLAGCVMAINQQKGSGGELARLWSFLKLVKSIVGGEMFSSIWQGFATNGNGFGNAVVNSIRGHWGRSVLSAHNAFENQQQRFVVERLQRFAGELSRSMDNAETGKLLAAGADVYHLSITLPDMAFVPLSAWTWASYYARGGLGAPTPLSSLVERDWATRDFLVAYSERTGLGDAGVVEDKVIKLVAAGRESEELRQHVFGVKADPDELVVLQRRSGAALPAGQLVRPVDGPILEPVANHSWESRYVLNAAAVRLDGTIYILYRAFGDDEVSRIGLAWTKDGVTIDGRLDRPIFEPSDSAESAGVEDPRVTVIDGQMYMLYTAWDHKVAQIGLASISVDAFLGRRFDEWQRHGLGFPGLANKDAVLYPEKFGGRYVIYHRIDPNLWISYLDTLECPWPRQGQKIIAGPRPGMMWDGIKVGAGAPPIKTTHGWLNIYHGVDYERSYRLGVLFMALDDPAKVIYQSPNAILSPETDFEIGLGGEGGYWVPRVVFTCGAVPAEDREVIGPDDDILIYYGAADTAIGVARARLSDLVPILKK